jgi:heat shock protein HtpX
VALVAFCATKRHNSGEITRSAQATRAGRGPASARGILPAVTTGGGGGWRRRLARRWSDRLVSGLHAEVLADPDRPLPARGRASAVALGLAALVHLTTLALVVLGGWLAVVTPFRLGGILLGVLLVALAWDVRPRLGRRPDPLREFDVGAAPGLRALVDRVATAVDVEPPTVIVLTGDVNASVREVGLRRERVLDIGAPLWIALAPDERVALLAHELGHLRGGDARRGTVVGAALTTLREWYLLANDERTVGVGRSRRMMQRTADGALVRLSSWVAMWLFRLIGLVPLVTYWLLLAVTLRSSQREEYAADRAAASVAGRDGMLGALRLLGHADELRLALRSATMGSRTDLLATASSFVATAPAREARTSELGPGFSSHPPRRLRMEAVAAVPDREPLVGWDAESAAAADREIAPALRQSERWLRDSFL